MKGRPVDQLVYEHMFPKPRASDPQNFHALLQRSLILEVRQEVHSFYGHLDTQEAKYPGLDYCNPIHRIRLSRWTWHRRLFRAFDNLRLTPNEIAGLTKWEGTKWAKERYEKEQGITIRDTAGDGFPDWVEPEDRPALPARDTTSQSVDTDDASDPGDEDMDGEESDEELHSVGEALNQRLRERVAQRDAGDMSTVLDEEWEQWLKNVIESGELPFINSSQIAQRGVSDGILTQPPFPSSMLSAARAGQWQDIPDFLHDIIRRTLEAPNSSVEAPPPSNTNPPRERRDTDDHYYAERIMDWRRRHSGLRLPFSTEVPMTPRELAERTDIRRWNFPFTYPPDVIRAIGENDENFPWSNLEPPGLGDDMDAEPSPAAS
ncbi:hypothetical protein CkaCkLH20_06704 [Colletotrichum karsti]|uniref:Uncharacterized protein n=1 Tax=Colletotrichum karsti TaxID=1095194 RepID=A0A9P6I2I2_9PEZI|nr:uncharacterized protein CkaCkLH20_06704 [Colletotrichum karsti]KAF9875772.1 hypothetical protein CkaCkLH20_06704 [Colletotrichum karsti]